MINDDLIEFIISQTYYSAFYKITNLLHNPEELIKRRIELENQVIENINSIEDLTKRKEVFVQIYFGYSSVNTLYNIETILERVDSNNEFKELVVDNNIRILNEIKDFLENTNLSDEIDSYIDLFKVYGNLSELLDKLFNLAKNTFFEEVKSAVNKSDIIRNIEPTKIRTKYDKLVNYYLLEGQTENQRNICMLTRTMDIRTYMRKENTISEYQKDMQRFDYLSFSLNNDEIYQAFCSKSEDRINLGYDLITDNTFLSANTRDGNTNQFTLYDGGYVLRQQYFGLKAY